jgi:polar amino acid transport system substrate-binding protein
VFGLKIIRTDYRLAVTGVIATLLIGTAPLELWGAGTPLRFCIDSTAMPRSGQRPDGSWQGVDVEVARLIAAKLQRPYRLHGCPADACRWKKLKNGDCDVVIGVPEGVPNRSIASWTAPYAAGQFGLVTERENRTIQSLGNLRGRRVGLVTGTIPLSGADHTLVRFASRKALLDGFRAAKLDAALVDTDFTAWYLRMHPEKPLRVVAEFVPQHRWSIGLAVRADQRQLKSQLERAVTDLLERAAFTAIFARYGLVHRAPLVEPSRPVVVTDTWKKIQREGKLSVSMDPANLPYSSADPEKPGFDLELAQAVASELGVGLKLSWIDVLRETAIGELLDFECDVALGAAVDPQAMDDEEELAGKVIYSRPYYGTGYLLVKRDDSPAVKSLTELQGDRSRRIGTQAGTIADYNLRQNGYLRRLFGTQLAVLTALDQGDIDYAYLWSNIGWMVNTSPELNAVLIEDQFPEERWNIAIAMRRGDTELKTHVDAAVKRLIEKGVVSEILSKYHTPYFPAFREANHATTKPSAKGQAPLGQQQTAPTTHHQLDRGLEPKMDRRQHSRKQYGGLAKIRSRGTLVVALDQHNLPFSTAHPKPSGLDYEIAQQLASALGVSLEVYWAYSSHDSYPGKLASKKSCDVILGITPDDRFTGRVIYTNPYYHAGYQWAVRPEMNSKPSADRPVAVESGVAVRGLEGRVVRSYPDLSALFVAVTSGEVDAAYVVSTRGNWLANRHWPGRLEMLPAGDTVDRFPICAAVRRTEPDLKEAIDEAFVELQESATLKKLFARWHIPIDVDRSHSEVVP